MSYCPKCGKQVMDETLGCPVCTLKEQGASQTAEPKIELVKSFTVEDESGESQRFETPTPEPDTKNWESYQNAESRPVQNDTIPTVLKVIIILAIILIGGIGAIAGIIAGIILSKSPVDDYRKFAKTLIAVSAVMIAVWFLCCFVGGAFGLLGNIGYYMNY